jgi:hypothetical protein
MSNRAQSVVIRKARPALGDISSRLAVTTPFVSNAFEDIAGRVASLRIPPSPPAMQLQRLAGAHPVKSIAERLFDATAELKILTSQVAMHMEDEWRERLFKQLDRLHAPDEWDEEDHPVERASFSTFLKAIFDIRPAVRPGLGLSNNGCLIAAWTAGDDRLTLQFLPNDRVKWVISRYVDGELDQVAGDTPVRRLGEALALHNAGKWFANAEVRPAAS